MKWILQQLGSGDHNAASDIGKYKQYISRDLARAISDQVLFYYPCGHVAKVMSCERDPIPSESKEYTCWTVPFMWLFIFSRGQDCNKTASNQGILEHCLNPQEIYAFYSQYGQLGTPKNLAKVFNTILKFSKFISVQYFR